MFFYDARLKEFGKTPELGPRANTVSAHLGILYCFIYRFAINEQIEYAGIRSILPNFDHPVASNEIWLTNEINQRFRLSTIKFFCISLIKLSLIHI